MTTFKHATIASIIASGFTAVVLGLAAPASAGVDDLQWIHDNQQRATVGAVTPVFGNGR